MYAKLTAAIVAGLFVCAGAVSASADVAPAKDNGKFKCPGKAVKSDWMLLSASGDPSYCRLKVNSKNKISGNCFFSDEPNSKSKASGTIEVNNNCAVSGKLTLKIDGVTSTGTIQANMTKSQTTILGILVSTGGGPDKNAFGTFTAVRIEKN